MTDRHDDPVLRQHTGWRANGYVARLFIGRTIPRGGRDLGDGSTLRIRGRPTETFRIGSFPWRINHGIEDGGSRHSRHGIYARRVLWGKQSIRRRRGHTFIRHTFIRHTFIRRTLIRRRRGHT